VTEIHLRVLSLGAGVQSTTLALMAAAGEIGPMPDCAIFADTMAEPKGVYAHLEWLETQLPFPVYRVSAGNLKEVILSAMNGDRRMDARPPFFTAGGGMLRRQCTGDFKIDVIQRKVRELLGLRPRQRSPRSIEVEQWIGISTDELIRVKPSRLPYVVHRWPLIERRMNRHDCLRWFEARFPGRNLTKSACTFCPYHNNDQWREMKANDPDAWAEAVAVDRAIRPGMPGPKRPEGTRWFVHADRVPLDEVDLSTPEDRGQLNLFLNECEGMCGV
jgi:hypothetical protein